MKMHHYKVAVDVLRELEVARAADERAGNDSRSFLLGSAAIEAVGGALARARAPKLVPLALGGVVPCFGAIEKFQVIPDEPLRPRHLVYAGPVGTFVIKNVFVGNRSQFPVVQDLPPECFPPPWPNGWPGGGPPYDLAFDLIHRMMVLSVEVQNVTRGDARFDLLVLCERPPVPEGLYLGGQLAPAVASELLAGLASLPAVVEATVAHPLAPAASGLRRQCGGCGGTGATAEGATCGACRGEGSVPG
jgi:hypothetical protein